MCACVVRVCLCVCTIRACVTERETSKKMFFTQARGFHPSPFRRTKTINPPASERQKCPFLCIWGEISTIPWDFFSSLLCFQARIQPGAVQYPLPIAIQLHCFTMKVERHESLPMPNMLAQVSLITMFKKGLNWNYMMLMPSVRPYPQCLIAHSDGIHCLSGIFYFVR